MRFPDAPAARAAWTSSGVSVWQTGRSSYPPPQMQTRFPYTEEGIGEAVESALEMSRVKSTIVPAPDLIEDD